MSLSVGMLLFDAVLICPFFHFTQKYVTPAMKPSDRKQRIGMELKVNDDTNMDGAFPQG